MPFFSVEECDFCTLKEYDISFVDSCRLYYEKQRFFEPIQTQYMSSNQGVAVNASYAMFRFNIGFSSSRILEHNSAEWFISMIKAVRSRIMRITWTSKVKGHSTTSSLASNNKNMENTSIVSADDWSYSEIFNDQANIEVITPTGKENSNRTTSTIQSIPVVNHLIGKKEVLVWKKHKSFHVFYLMMLS